MRTNAAFRFGLPGLFTLLLAAILVLGSSPIGAQQDERATLRMPWSADSGFGFHEPDGTPRSFFIDLVGLIAKEADINVDLVEYASAEAARQSIRDGETELFVDTGRTELDAALLLFTEPVAETQLRLYQRYDAPFAADFASFEGEVLGVVRNSIASRTPMPDGISVVEYDDLVTAFAQALGGEVDGVLALSSLARRTLTTTGLDDLIVPGPFSAPSVAHVVALRREHADLMPQIEDALARLEQRGDLQDLRKLWDMVTPPPAPEVLTVGVTHFPPYYVVNDDGTVTGFAVEIIEELADRAGLELRFEVVSLESWSKGPRIGAFDLLPARSVTEIENEFLEFTVPIQTIDYVPFVRAEDAGLPLSLVDGRIGILFTAPLRDEIAQALGVNLRPLETPQAAVDALENGTIDALFYARSAFESFLETNGGGERFARLPEPAFRNDLAIAMRSGLGDLDTRLNVVIQGFIGSAQYRSLASRWFDAPPFWTAARIRLAQIGVAAILSVALLAVFLLVLQGRRRALRHADAMESLSTRLGAVLDTAQSAILGFNRAGEIAFSNACARAMIPDLVTDSPESWPKHISFLDPETGEPLNEERHPICSALAGSDLKGEVALMRRDTSGDAIRYVRVSSTPALRSVAGDIATVVILDDVSDLYESRQNAEDQAKIAAAAQKQESIGKLTGGIAHDFNNLLAVILGNLEFLQDEEADPERARFTKNAIDATLRGAELVRNMLAFARRSPIEAQVLDLNEVTHAVEALAARTLPASVKIETSLLAGLWKIRADRSLTESALLNLLLNASDAMKGVGRLTIETSNLRIDEDYIDDRQEDIPVGRYVMLAVSDDGPGIPEKIVSQIFEPFFTTKGPQGGSGLGLSMVHGFMKQTGGTVRVYTEPGVGTTFKLYFPAFHVAGTPSTERPADAALPSGAGERVLLVEDQPDVLAALKRALERGGYEVVTAETGDLALNIFEGDPAFDIVVTDIVMPGNLQGPRLVKALRAISPELPAIFMSGYAEEATVHGNGLRPTDIRLMKPVQRTAFFAALERALLQAKTRE
ncbi:transporter substrate-binding domain-containing protein [Primorskyibacter sp. 2E107]|uniref:transporter substrate-binding domain-containing protein n=1 Tax=Primorskyibacter sp. 2E107 TaxID=3403458 RepID=UPI003AF7BFEB